MGLEVASRGWVGLELATAGVDVGGASRQKVGGATAGASKQGVGGAGASRLVGGAG